MGSSSKFWVIDGDGGAVHFDKCEIGVRESGGIFVVIYSLLKVLGPLAWRRGNQGERERLLLLIFAWGRP